MCVELIKNLVEEEFKVQIIRKTRRRKYVEARAMYYKLLLDKKNMTLDEIAKTLNKHHATVLNGKKKLSDWMETDSNIESIYRGLEKRVDAIIGKYPDKFEKTKSERQLYISEYEELEGRYRALRGRHNLLLSEIKRLTPNYNAYFKRFKELETNNI